MDDILSTLFQTVYAVIGTHAFINASVPSISIPAEITPILNNSNTSTTVDVSTISGITAIGMSIFAAVKDRLGNKTMDNRTASLINNDQHLLNSQKSTDLAAQDTSVGINALITKLREDPNLARLLDAPTDPGHGLDGKSVSQFFKEDKEDWKDSNKAYYENKVPLPESNSKDPIVQKSSEIAQLTTPTNI